MSPNGRRAWRKWCKSRRRKMNAHHCALYTGAKMRKKQPERTPLPPRPFTARSLVGMTMGARKRAASLRYQSARFLCDDDNSDWSALRAKYRIGERLRPCPGCEECRGYDDGIGVIHCDGSGVQPARKAKR